MARQAARLIAAALLAAFAAVASAQPSQERLKTPQTRWSELAPAERRILGPIEENWDRLPGYQQQRLISSARKYPSLQPIQKERFDTRIRDWAAMSSEQRRAARETFQGLRRLPPDKQHELRERWLQRHRPPDEQRNRADESSEPRFERQATPPRQYPRGQRPERPERPQQPPGEAPPPGR